MIAKRTKKLEKIADQISSDDFQEKWENGELGNSEEYAKATKRPTSIRLPDSLIDELKLLAKREGLSSYQTYIKMILTKHVKKEKNKKRVG
ncbi:MAG: hypothetical protein HQK54_10185 [Oligoflexales bacterium]|nr:hypothetical protein [Oligoflexales bacterium]